jgi:hypothetical protein
MFKDALLREWPIEDAHHVYSVANMGYQDPSLTFWLCDSLGLPGEGFRTELALTVRDFRCWWRWWTLWIVVGIRQGTSSTVERTRHDGKWRGMSMSMGKVDWCLRSIDIGGYLYIVFFVFTESIAIFGTDSTWCRKYYGGNRVVPWYLGDFQRVLRSIDHKKDIPDRPVNGLVTKCLRVILSLSLPKWCCTRAIGSACHNPFCSSDTLHCIIQDLREK